MFHPLPLTITDDLRIAIGGAAEVVLSPSQGLRAAEVLARKAFRRAMTEEAEALGATPAKVPKPRQSRGAAA